MNFKTMNFRNKLLCILIPLMIVSVALPTLVSYKITGHSLKEVIRNDLSLVVDQFHTFIENNPDMEWSKIRAMCNEELQIGERGFIFVIDPKGNLLVHKKHEGENWIDKSFIKQIVNKKNGDIRYLSPETNTYKVACFRYFEEWDWIIVASAFEDDFLSKPLARIVSWSAIVCVSAIGLTSVVIIVSLSSTFKALRRIIYDLRSSSDQTTSASSQVSSASQSLAKGATDQAAGLEEISSSLEEMSSMTRQNADNAQQANILSSDARKAADAGTEAMQRMNGAINEIQKSSDETAKIIKVIDEIAFQTNLLALNAAVEAARAGEAGKGFAVVAEEVRNLAMRSAEAAKNTANMIEESVKNSKNGVDIAAEVGKVLEEIVQSIGKTTDLVSEIAAASQEQAQGIDQINTAMTQMDKVTQQNAANAEESASASEELSAQAEPMNDVVNELLRLVEGASTKQNKSYGHQHPDVRFDHGAVKKTKKLLNKKNKGNGLKRSDETFHKIANNSEQKKGSAMAAARKAIPMDGDENTDLDDFGKFNG
jgi:methyl-accepting chemotaxis protein